MAGFNRGKRLNNAGFPKVIPSFRIISNSVYFCHIFHLPQNTNFHEAASEPEEVTISDPTVEGTGEEHEEQVTFLPSTKSLTYGKTSDKQSEKAASKIVLSPAMVTLANHARKKNGSGGMGNYAFSLFVLRCLNQMCKRLTLTKYIPSLY